MSLLFVMGNLFVTRVVTCVLLLTVPACESDEPLQSTESTHVFFVDSNQGNDSNDGLTVSTPWKTLSKVESNKFVPGDTVKFKRGSSFNTALTIKNSGAQGKYIVLTAYGDANDNAPTFTNTVFDPDKGVYGNCIRLKGSFVIVENLYFEHTVAQLSGTIGFVTMWELGAVYIDKTASYCIVKNNEFFDCGVGIKSYGPHALITQNYLHDCNRVLKEWGWGPLAIWLGGDHQEVSYNKVVNYSAVDARINWGPDSYGGGVDGGVIEIDDGRVPKSNIEIHHNYTRENQGFIEVTWTDVVQNPPYEGFKIHHNVSDDYQQFIALWCGTKCKIENNTIIRRKRNVTDWGVFNITQNNSKNYVRNNLVVVENDVIVFPGGRLGNARAGSIISNNLFFAASGELKMGVEGPGEDAVNINPMFLNYSAVNDPLAFSLTVSSPGVNTGLPLGYQKDFKGVAIPQQSLPDIGAFEFSN